MTPRQLLDSGNLTDALRALTSEVRDNPADSKRRTFLFELLCFAGEFDRAEKHLDVLSQENQSAALGTLLYRTALQGERIRGGLFEKREYPAASDDGNAKPLTGTCNGMAFSNFSDADPRIGARLEVFAAGDYLWIPFQQIESIEISPPKQLRDLIWVPAVVRTGPGFDQKELGELFIPALSPFSWRHPDDAVRLGRMTVWESEETGEAVPFGQKLFLVDDVEVPVLELRSLRFSAEAQATS